MQALGIRSDQALKRLSDLHAHVDYHARATQTVIDAQIDPPAAAQLNDAGGGVLVVASVLGLLDEIVEVRDESV
jgi:pentose-5-phosphate-3-epimerase